MTLIAAAITRRTVWMMADRRLSALQHGTWVPNSEDAVKFILLQTADSNGFVGYSGLGRTALGCELSEWLSRTIRNYDGPLWQFLELIRQAANNRIPKHIASHDYDHTFLVPAMVNSLPRVFGIFVARNAAGQYTTELREVLVEENKDGYAVPMVVFAGSGIRAISKDEKQRVKDHLIAYDDGKLTERQIAHVLNSVNFKVHKKLGSTGTVGNRTITSWSMADKTGNTLFFRDLAIDSDPTPAFVPAIMGGFDATAIAAVATQFMPTLEEIVTGKADEILAKNAAAHEAAVRKIPSDPDDSLP